jgi:hypothetical protein
VTRNALDTLPNHEAITARVARLLRGASSAYVSLEERGGVWFARKSDKEKNQPLLVLMRSPNRPGG